MSLCRKLRTQTDCPSRPGAIDERFLSVRAAFVGAARGILCVGLVLLVLTAGYGRRNQPRCAAIVHREVVESHQGFVGAVTPIRRVTIGSAVDGRVVDVMVDEGDPVAPLLPPVSAGESSAGQAPGAEVDASGHPAMRLPPQAGYPLAQLLTDTIDIELAAAQAELRVRQAVLQELEASLPADLELAKLHLSAARTRYDLSKRQLDRTQSLMANGRIISESELDEAQSAFDAADLELSSALAELRRLENTREARLAQAQAEVARQTELLRLLQDRRNKFTVRAPFEGIVSARYAELGQWVSVGTAVAEVVQMNPIDVVISVPQSMIQDLQFTLAEVRRRQASGDGQADGQAEMRAEITIADNDQPIIGRVVALVPSADLLSRSFPVKVRLENPLTELGYQFNPGMLVRVRLPMGKVQQRLLVDKDALVLNNEGRYVVLIDRSTTPATVRQVPVQIGAAVDHRVEIQGAIGAADWVVVEGNERLRNGQAVVVLNETTLKLTASEPEPPVAKEVAAAVESLSGSVTN